MRSLTPVRGDIEIWAGVECTVNRVRDQRFDQMARSGHRWRIEDLDLFAELAPRRLRYPVLWETVAPEGDLARADWSWPDERLQRLRTLGLEPIAGLIHHGSGPSNTDLLDVDLPQKLAQYARAVAERYPWMLDYTPINEPLTTARFSALYGHWYPHMQDHACFLRALVNQCLATAAAMREIRAVQPQARLVQTEDLGTTTSTPRLRYQADFDNARRWLGFDLLCGRVDVDHPFWPALAQAVGERALADLLERPCPPDIIGINYYVTSDRHLDENLAAYPAWSHGGNGRDVYADVETVRVLGIEISGHEKALSAAWERYRIPVALTEVHIDSTREDQLRWLQEAWYGAHRARDAGADVRAITPWALLGSFDWNSLVTRDAGYYESGAFDLRTPDRQPRRTAVADMIRSYSIAGAYAHPVLSHRGWWRRPCRAFAGTSREADQDCLEQDEGGTPLLITGATGTLGRAFARLCRQRAIPYRLVSRKEMDIADPESVLATLKRIRPWAVVNTAGYVRVDDAESDRMRCFRENTEGAAVLARECRRLELPMMTFSTDLVFDGSSSRPYVESDRPRPLNAYGESKAEAEKLVLSSWDGALIVRTSAFFGPWDEHNFLKHATRCWRSGTVVEADPEQVVTPTYVPELARICLDLLIDGETGLWHVANPDAVSWAELALRLAALQGYPASLVRATRARTSVAPRPRYSALGSERGVLLPSLQSCLERYVADCAQEAQPSVA
ncbi:MAG TPA: family 1 glycosylhydrolase [Candidatus Limnocylindrales bacterium]|nr:family 1 glycosylhydrolase [Candidatus Limnocylindrales bacterium]